MLNAKPSAVRGAWTLLMLPLGRRNWVNFGDLWAGKVLKKLLFQETMGGYTNGNRHATTKSAFWKNKFMLEVAIAAFGVKYFWTVPQPLSPCDKQSNGGCFFGNQFLRKNKTNQQSKLQRWNWVVTLTNHPVFDLHRYVFVEADHTAESRHSETEKNTRFSHPLFRSSNLAMGQMFTISKYAIERCVCVQY